MRPLVAAALAFLVAAIIVIVVGAGGKDDQAPKPKAAARPLVTLEPPVRDLGVQMTYGGTPNLVVKTPGTDSGLPLARVFTTVRFSIDGKLVKTRTAPPYTISNLPSGPHVVTITGTASGGDNARIQESYVK